MTRIIFATCLADERILPSDRVLGDALEKRGATVIGAPWNGPFSVFEGADLVLIRTTWDYFEAADDYYHWFEALEAASLKVLNPLATLRWNARKDYLFEIQAKGAPLIPTVRVEENIDNIISTAKEHGWDRAVLKCLLSGGARGLSLIDPTDATQVEQALEAAKPWSASGLMLQPFLPQIKTDGELSLIYLFGAFSHAIRKTPKDGEIRIQSEFGGQYQRIEVSDETLAAAEKCLACAPGMPDTPPAYARIDGLILEDGFRLMEMELTEPELMFDHAPEAAEKMADQLLASL